jgi:hypothetical protein
MFVLAELALTLVSLTAPLPQGGSSDPAAGQAPLLTPAEQKSLHDKLTKMVAARIEYDGSQGRDREKAGKSYEKEREAFDKEWAQRVEKKGNLLRSPVDVAAIFDNCFTFQRKTAQPIKLENPPKGVSPFCLSVPKSYKAELPARTVLVMPGALDSGAGWIDGREWFTSTWDKSAAVGDTLFHINQLNKDVDFDTPPNFDREGDEAKEIVRFQELLGSFGETNRGYNLDRRRVFLDCGRGSCAFALRAAANFPDRFAGLILRDPVEPGALRLGSLTGVPVLLLADGKTGAAATKLQEALNALAKDSCKVLTPTDAYPFKGAAADIEAWMAGVKRDLARPHVVLEPNDDRFRRGFWVSIDRMDVIRTSPPDQRPRIEATVDRAGNRITVKCVGIETFALTLSDALIDLDKEYTIEVNGKPFAEKRARDFNAMLDAMIKKFDPEYLFPVTFRCTVPRVEEPKKAEEPKKSEESKK